MNTPTPAQIALITKLSTEYLELRIEWEIAEGNLEAAKGLNQMRSQFPMIEGLNRSEVSRRIDEMIQIHLPKARANRHVQVTPPRNDVEPMTDGIFFKDGIVFKVQRAVHGSGSLYAKVLDVSTERFEYAPGAIRRLTLADKMTRQQAEEFGKLYGICCVCSRTLTNEDSIERGIGPVCAGRV
jgi:hypothetical protein